MLFYGPHEALWVALCLNCAVQINNKPSWHQNCLSLHVLLTILVNFFKASNENILCTAPLMWILTKMEAHQTLNCFILLSLFSLLLPTLPLFFSLMPSLNGAADELGIEFMGKTTFLSFFHWLHSPLSLSRPLRPVKAPHTVTKTAQSCTTRPLTLGKLMRAGRHGNTVVVN